MLSFGRRKSRAPESTRAGAFGKIPAAGDFVQTPANEPVVRAFQEWVEHGIERAALRGEAFKGAFEKTAVRAFVFRPPRTINTDTLITGLMQPSHDAVGRRFPLVVYSLLPQASLVGAAHVLPLVVGEFLDAAHQLLENGASQDSRGLQQSVMAQSGPQLDSVQQVLGEYEQWTQTSPLYSAWQATYGSPLLGAPAQGIETLAAALEPFRGQEAPPTKVAVQVPLGTGGAAAAAFWLDVIRRIAGWRKTIATCFWVPFGHSASSVIQLGETPPSTFSELWLPDSESESLCDLTSFSGADGAEVLERLSPAWTKVMSNPNASVAEFLDALSG